MSWRDSDQVWPSHRWSIQSFNQIKSKGIHLISRLAIRFLRALRESLVLSRILRLKTNFNQWPKIQKLTIILQQTMRRMQTWHMIKNNLLDTNRIWAVLINLYRQNNLTKYRLILIKTDSIKICHKQKIIRMLTKLWILDQMPNSRNRLNQRN